MIGLSLLLAGFGLVFLFPETLFQTNSHPKKTPFWGETFFGGGIP